MTTELQFSKIKSDVEKLTKEYLDNFFKDKDYDPKDAKEWTKTIAKELITKLNDQRSGFKYICNCTIFQKGDAIHLFSSSCVWNPNTDGLITVQHKSDQIYCYCCIFGVAP